MKINYSGEELSQRTARMAEAVLKNIEKNDKPKVLVVGGEKRMWNQDIMEMLAQNGNFILRLQDKSHQDLDVSIHPSVGLVILSEACRHATTRNTKRMAKARGVGVYPGLHNTKTIEKALAVVVGKVTAPREAAKATEPDADTQDVVGLPEKPHQQENDLLKKARLVRTVEHTTAYSAYADKEAFIVFALDVIETWRRGNNRISGKGIGKIVRRHFPKVVPSTLTQLMRRYYLLAPRETGKNGENNVHGYSDPTDKLLELCGELSSREAHEAASAQQMFFADDIGRRLAELSEKVKRLPDVKEEMAE